MISTSPFLGKFPFIILSTTGPVAGAGHNSVLSTVFLRISGRLGWPLPSTQTLTGSGLSKSSSATSSVSP